MEGSLEVHGGLIKKERFERRSELSERSSGVLMRRGGVHDNDSNLVVIAWARHFTVLRWDRRGRAVVWDVNSHYIRAGSGCVRTPALVPSVSISRAVSVRGVRASSWRKNTQVGCGGHTCLSEGAPRPLVKERRRIVKAWLQWELGTCNHLWNINNNKNLSSETDSLCIYIKCITTIDSFFFNNPFQLLITSSNPIFLFKYLSLQIKRRRKKGRFACGWREN